MMNRLIVSGLYTVLSFGASLAIILIIIRSASLESQAGFFLFQAVFFVLTTVMSQAYALDTFHGLRNGIKNIRLDLLALGVVLLYLWFLGKGQFSVFEQIAYALATVLFYRGASLLVAVQYHSQNHPAMLWVPFSAAGLRIITAWFLRDYEPAIIFAGSALVNFLIPVLVLSLGIVNGGLVSRQTPSSEAPNALTTLPFFLIWAFTFQWDRIIYALADASESLLITGYVMTVVMAPLSTLFATIFRGSAALIFTDSDLSLQRSRLLQIGGLFAGASVCYLLLLVFFWEQVMKVLGVSATPSSVLALLLGVAVIVDRITVLSIFLSGEVNRYKQTTFIKIVLIAIGSAFALWYGLTKVEYFYAMFLVLAFANAVVLMLLRK